MLVIVSASMWMPLASRSPRAASETACWNRSRSVMSSSMVSVPAMDRSDPSSTFFTIVSIWLSGSPMNRSAAARRRSGSRAILNIAWPVMSTPTPCLLTAAFSLVRPISTWRAVSCRRPTLLMSGQTNVPPPTTTLTPLSSSVVTVPAASRNLLPCAPEMMSASFAPATRYLRAARSASMTMTAMVAKISCVIVIDTLIPSFHSRDAPAVLRRRHLSNGDAHPVDRDDLDVTASGDRGRRDGGQDLHRAVVGETDRAARPRPDAHGDASGPSDKVLESGRLGRLGPAEAAKDQERERETGQPERRRRAELSDGPEAEGDAAEQAAEAEHREETEQQRGHGRMLDAHEREPQVRHPDRHVHAQPRATAQDGEEEEHRAKQRRAGEEELQRAVRDHRGSPAFLEGGSPLLPVSVYRAWQGRGTARGRSVADVDDLLLGEEIERRGAALTIPEARVLHAAERHVRLPAEGRQVHVEHARL